MNPWQLMPSPAGSAQDSYYESLGQIIAWYRRQDMPALRGCAYALFEEDLNMVVTGCTIPPRTHDHINEIRAAVFSLLFRKKYARVFRGFQVSFVITPDGLVVFDEISMNTIIERYALALKEVTPDSEILLRPLAERSNVKFKAGDFKS